MSITRSIAAVATAAALAIPSAALAVGPPTTPGAGHRPAGTPADTTHPTAAQHPGNGPGTTTDPTASPSGKARAYGKLCQNESKEHVQGQKGTPFSQCVTAMAKAASGKARTARAACASLSHKHKKGEKGTPFSRCMAAASKLLAG
jgi:hypothetical protein